MKAAVNVYCSSIADTGLAAAVVFRDWADAAPLFEQVHVTQRIAAYVPGQFNRWELPCILPLIQSIREHWPLSLVIVDGYVDRGPEQPGLGRHLHHALGQELEVVGVAKSRFAGSQAVAVCRGRSRRPLWVTSTSSDRVAAALVEQMHGPQRIPMLLRRVDALVRQRADEVGI